MAQAPRSQGAASLLRLARTTLRDNFDRFRVEHNLELEGTITIAGLNSKDIESREEATLDERVLPQALAGVWIRIIDRDEHPSLTIGEARSTFGMEVTTFINSQSFESDSTVATTAQDGYERVEQIALVVEDTIRSGIRGQGGVYMIIPRRSGGRIPRVLRNMPSIHVITNVFDVGMRTRKPVQGAAGVGEDLGDYGGWYLTADDSTQVIGAGDVDTYVKMTGASTAGPIAGMSHATPNRLTNSKTISGCYEISFVTSVTVSSSSTVLEFKVFVDGAEVADWEQHRTVAAGGDLGNISIRALVTLASDSFVEIYVASDTATTITYNHAAMTVHKVA